MGKASKNKQPRTPPGGYEFREDQNIVISGMASAMKIAGMLWLLYGLVAGGLSLAGTLGRSGAGAQLVGGVIGLVLNTLMGVWTINAASSFENVATTTGKDIQETMAALVNLRRYYSTLRVVLVVALVLGGVGLAVTMGR